MITVPMTRTSPLHLVFSTSSLLIESQAIGLFFPFFFPSLFLFWVLGFAYAHENKLHLNVPVRQRQKHLSANISKMRGLPSQPNYTLLLDRN